MSQRVIFHIISIVCDRYQTMSLSYYQSVTSRSREFPFPGIPVPGNCSLFLMVSEKFGSEKSLGIGIEKNLVPKKVSESVSKKFGTEKKSRNRSRKKLVPEKSLGTGIGKIFYPN